MPLVKLSLTERIQLVRLSSIYQNPKSIQAAWMKKFKTAPPSAKTIKSVNRKFDETGSVTDLTRTGRPKTSTSSNNVSLVKDTIKRDPSKTLRTLSSELNIAKTSVQRIKREAEKNGTLGIEETSKLKLKIFTLNRKIGNLERSKSEGESLTLTSSSTSAAARDVGEAGPAPNDIFFDNHNHSYRINEDNFGGHFIHLIEPSLSTENGTQLLQIAPDTFQFLQAHCSEGVDGSYGELFSSLR